MTTISNVKLVDGVKCLVEDRPCPNLTAPDWVEHPLDYDHNSSWCDICNHTDKITVVIQVLKHE